MSRATGTTAPSASDMSRASMPAAAHRTGGPVEVDERGIVIRRGSALDTRCGLYQLRGVDQPLLKFLERNCVQCGLCEATCPEEAISLAPRLLLTPAVREARVLNETQPKEAEMLRMSLKGPNVMDEYKAKKIQLRRLPQKQSIEDWNDTWSQFKAL